MIKININPFIKFAFLIFQILIVVVFDDSVNLIYFLILSILILLLSRVNIKYVLSSMVFGIFLSIFSFVFSFLISNSIDLAIYKSLHLFIMYLIVLFYSLAYKKTSSNKEIAYVISYLFLPFSFLGYNQNKMYTMILIILNQVSELRVSAKRIYKYDSLNKKKISKINNLILLIQVFINNSLKQNDNFTIALISKNYSIDLKRVRPYFVYDYKVKCYIVLLFYLLLEILIIYK